MSTSNSFESLVDGLTAEVTAKVQSQVQASIEITVRQKIESMLTEDMLNSSILNVVTQRIDKYKPNYALIDQRLRTAGDALATNLNERVQRQSEDFVRDKVALVDVEKIAKEYVLSQLSTKGNQNLFPAGSIPGSAIDLNNFRITGDKISGGIISNFASTGVEDKASVCQVTILDQGTVFENTLYAPRLEIKGPAVIEGDLDLRGTIPASSPAYQGIVRDSVAKVRQVLAPDLTESVKNTILAHIATNGVNLSQLQLNGQQLLEGNRLTNLVINSQLQTVGVLRDLQTQGETLLSETLYTTRKRVGINTMDPSSALSVWDEETEVAVGKYKQNTARIATQRAVNLVLGANGKDNITLTSEGVTEISQLKLGNMMFGSTNSPPGYDAPKGTVLFNENPTLGGPLGWVSLGGARWANFGIID